MNDFLCFEEREEPGLKEEGSRLLRCVLQFPVTSRANRTGFTFVQLNAVRTNKSQADFSWPFDSCNIHTVLRRKGIALQLGVSQDSLWSGISSHRIILLNMAAPGVTKYT